MSQIIISDLEANQELDREALNDVLGGKRRGGYKNYHHVKYYYEEKYQESYSYKHKHHNHCYDYHPCHFDHFHCHW